MNGLERIKHRCNTPEVIKYFETFKSSLNKESALWATTEGLFRLYQSKKYAKFDGDGGDDTLCNIYMLTHSFGWKVELTLQGKIIVYDAKLFDKMLSRI